MVREGKGWWVCEGCVGDGGLALRPTTGGWVETQRDEKRRCRRRNAGAVYVNIVLVMTRTSSRELYSPHFFALRLPRLGKGVTGMTAGSLMVSLSPKSVSLVTRSSARCVSCACGEAGDQMVTYDCPAVRSRHCYSWSWDEGMWLVCDRGGPGKAGR